MARILVVDDNAVVVKHVAEELRKHGHEIKEALGGKDAIASLDSDKYDLMLLDLLMPEVSGYAVLDHIENWPEDRRPKVILATAFDSDLKRKYPLMVQQLMPKPYDPESLVQNVDRVLASVQENKP